MTFGYAKIFSTILGSSIWQEDAETRIVWITMLVMADREGVIRGSDLGLAHFARVSLDKCKEALERFKLPESHSSDGGDGRRIESVEGGWRILNHAKYSAMLTAEDRRAYWRQRKAKERAEARESGKRRRRVRAESESREKRFVEAHGAGNHDACDRIAAENLPGDSQ